MKTIIFGLAYSILGFGVLNVANLIGLNSFSLYVQIIFAITLGFSFAIMDFHIYKDESRIKENL